MIYIAKQNMKSCNARRRREQKQPKKSVGLISKKKTTLHVQHTFYVNLFAVVFHDHNEKLPQTS